MALRVATREPLLIAACLTLTAFATWSFTSVGHAEVQLTVKDRRPAPAGAVTDNRAANPARPSRG